MSSLRNAVAPRPHKERSQPKAREKWGILEKHKDYSLRARDYNSKKQKLSILSQKARDKNPDEFAFGMLSTKTGKQGKHGARGTENSLGHDAVKLLKSQDAGYLRTVAGRGRRELERLEEVVGLNAQLNGAHTRQGKKIVFEDGDEPMRGKKRGSGGSVIEDVDRPSDTIGMVVEGGTDAVPMESTLYEGENNTAQSNPKSKKALEKEHQAKLDLRAERRKRKRLGEVRAAKLAALKKRQKEIMAAADALDLQRAKMSRTVGGVNKDGVKWKIRERKR